MSELIKANCRKQFTDSYGKDETVLKRYRAFKDMLESTGSYSERREWRIFTTSLIYVNKVKDHYEVIVKCDLILKCRCNTTAGAFLMKEVLLGNIATTYFNFGWHLQQDVAATEVLQELAEQIATT